MKIRTVAATTLFSVALMLPAIAALASGECVVGCNLQQKACIAAEARTAKLTCMVDCKTNSAPRISELAARPASSSFVPTRITANRRAPCALIRVTRPMAIQPSTSCVRTCGQDLVPASWVSLLPVVPVSRTARVLRALVSLVASRPAGPLQRRTVRPVVTRSVRACRPAV